MNTLTASPSGDYTDLSIRLRTESYNQIQLQLNYEDEPVNLTYTIDQHPQIIKTLSDGIERDDAYDDQFIYTITIPDTDNIKEGLHRHFVQIENATGEFKASLDKGRVRVEV